MNPQIYEFDATPIQNGTMDAAYVELPFDAHKVW